MAINLTDQTSAAITACREAIAQRPGDIAAYERLAELYSESGNAKAAADLYLKIGALQQTVNPDYKPPKTASVGRNDPCPCGSGRKYKKCCAQTVVAAPKPPQQPKMNWRRTFESALQHHHAGRLQLAEEGYRQTLRLQPKHQPALLNLGSTLRKLGRPQEALEIYHKGLAVRPGDPKLHAKIHNNLGNALMELGRLEEAATQFKNALADNDNYAESHSNLGLALRKLGRFKESLEHCKKAVALKPDYADAHNNLGAVLGKLNHHQEGLRHLYRALELKPDFADVHNNISHVMQELERPEEARQHLVVACELEPDDPGGYSNLGSMLRLMGRMDEANACFEKALSLKPDHAMASYNMLQNKKVDETDRPFLDRLEDALRRPALGQEDEIFLHYALGKANDDLKHYDEAFAHYARANEIKRRRSPLFNREEHERRIDRIMEIYNADFFAQRRLSGHPSELPVHIVGMMRSGTSLTEQIVSSHPQAAGAGELVFWPNWNRKLRGMPAVLTPEQMQNIARHDITKLRSYSADALRVTDKLPHNFMMLGLIHAVFPRARLIHCMRNPADNGLSVYFQNFKADHYFAQDIADIAFYWRQYWRLMEHWRRVLPPDVFMEIRYEDLIDDQETHSRRLIEFCGLEWDERCMQFHKTERMVKTASTWQVRQSLYKTSSARWRHYERHIGPLLELMPLYDADIAPPP